MKRSVSVLGVCAVALTLTLVVQVQQAVSRGRASPQPPLELGQILPSVAGLNVQTGARKPLITDDAGCRVLVFFEPSCAACSEAAKTWRGGRSVSVGSQQAEVRWITQAERSAAIEWGRKWGVTDIAVVKAGDLGRLGVEYFPQFYIVGARRSLVAKGVGYKAEVVATAAKVGCGGQANPTDANTRQSDT